MSILMALITIILPPSGSVMVKYAMRVFGGLALPIVTGGPPSLMTSMRIVGGRTLT